MESVGLQSLPVRIQRQIDGLEAPKEPGREPRADIRSDVVTSACLSAANIVRLSFLVALVAAKIEALVKGIRCISATDGANINECFWTCKQYHPTTCSLLVLDDDLPYIGQCRGCNAKHWRSNFLF